MMLLHSMAGPGLAGAAAASSMMGEKGLVPEKRRIICYNAGCLSDSVRTQDSATHRGPGNREQSWDTRSAVRTSGGESLWLCSSEVLQRK